MGTVETNLTSGRIETLDDLMLAMKGRTEVATAELQDGITKEFEIIVRSGPRILGYETPTRIAPHRAQRPNYTGEWGITRDELKKIMWRFGMPTTEEKKSPEFDFSPDFDERVDRFLAKERAKEPLKGGTSKVDDCPFCYDNIEKITPSPRLYHEGVEMENGKRSVSFPNISPLARDHRVTVTDGHITDLSQLRYDSQLGKGSLDNLFLTGYQNALDYKKHGAVGIHIIANVGKSSGGTVPHIHTQEVPIMTMESFYDESERARIIRDLNGDGKRLMDRLMQQIRDSPLFIFENDQVLIYAAWAPRYPHHVEAIFKNPKGPNSGNVLDFDPYDLEIAGKSTTGVFHSLRKALDVTSLNFVLHQSSFVGEPHGFMMQAEFMPRNGYIRGGFEEGRKFYAVSTIPEKTADAVKKHYKPTK